MNFFILNKEGSEEKLKVKESGEDYLETILILKNRKNTVRSIDIAAEMGVSKASVCVAMRNLRAGGYISMDEEYEISLTKEGKQIAETIYERHLLFSQVLESLGVDHQTAVEDACRLEHAISPQSFSAFKNYLRKQGFPLEKER